MLQFFRLGYFGVILIRLSHRVRSPGIRRSHHCVDKTPVDRGTAYTRSGSLWSWRGQLATTTHRGHNSSAYRRRRRATEQRDRPRRTVVTRLEYRSEWRSEDAVTSSWCEYMTSLLTSSSASSSLLSSSALPASQPSLQGHSWLVCTHTDRHAVR